MTKLEKTGLLFCVGLMQSLANVSVPMALQNPGEYWQESLALFVAVMVFVGAGNTKP